MKKTYKFDDDFRAWARALQFAYREEILNDFNEEKAPKVLLSDENAKHGLIFCDGFRGSILKKVGNVSNEMTKNMLRSEHIPYNMFTPLEEMPEFAKNVFSDIIGVTIKEVEMPILIEYAGERNKSDYLNDGTSFDAFVRYRTVDGRRGAIGIEVKYTENEYRLGKTESDSINNPEGKYAQMTAESGYFIDELDVKMFLEANHLRQIWRNHILGYSMKKRGDCDLIHHVHLYPRNNVHFHNHALPEYQKLLSDAGRESFKAVTYEDYAALLEKHGNDKKIKDWVKYLRARYLGENFSTKI